MTFFDSIRDAAAKRAKYRQLVFELEGLSRSSHEDIGIRPGDERRVAHQAVYGM